MKKLVVIILSLTLLSCFNNKKEEKKDLKQNTTSSSSTGRQNFIVIWQWTTDNLKLVKKYSEAQTYQLQTMWENDFLRNLYYKSDLEVDELEKSPNISFFIKAKDETDAKKILNELVFVKNNIATYTLYPVGTKWLARNTNQTLEKGGSKTYIAIWTTLDDNPSDAVLKAQSEAVQKLWGDGLVENVYFLIDSALGKNSKTDFVFFVNSDSEMDAEKVLDKLPFVENSISSYELRPVGNFWKGFKMNMSRMMN